MDYGKLKTYYESIDGVTVPFVYPQYWDKDKEEWVVVDKDNRLPVDARVTGSKVEEITALGARDVTVLAGATHFTTSIYNPVNVSAYNYLIVKVKASSQGALDVLGRYAYSETDVTVVGSETLKAQPSESGVNGTSFRFEVNSDIMRIGIRNKTSDDLVYSIRVIGIV